MAKMNYERVRQQGMMNKPTPSSMSNESLRRSKKNSKPKLMRAKFDSTCSTCGGKIKRQQQMLWDGKARHVSSDCS